MKIQIDTENKVPDIELSLSYFGYTVTNSDGSRYYVMFYKDTTGNVKVMKVS